MKYKYTDYIINGNMIDINSVVSENKYAKLFTIPLASTVAIFGVIFLSCFLPFMVTIDSARQMKFHYIKIKRKYHVNYIFLIPIDKIDKVFKKYHIKLNIHDIIRQNEINMKLKLLDINSQVKNIF